MSDCCCQRTLQQWLSACACCMALGEKGVKKVPPSTISITITILNIITTTIHELQAAFQAAFLRDSANHQGTQPTIKGHSKPSRD
eukprot:7879747-Lingulodinium_polyedra.AAC.2